MSGESTYVIGHQEHVVLLQDRLDLLEITLRRHMHAASTHDRLGEERGDRVRPFALDGLVQLLGELFGEIALRHAVWPTLIGIRAGDMEDLGNRQVDWFSLIVLDICCRRIEMTI